MTRMQTGLQTTTDALMEHFAADNKYWATDVADKGLADPTRQALTELGSTIGSQSPLLCVGGVSLDVTPSPEGATSGADYPYLYDLTVVTQQLIVNAWGWIRGAEKELDRELTRTLGLKGLASIEVDLRPGELPGDGIATKHHEVALKFTNGSTFELPNNEWLSDKGAERMEGLLPRLYAML
ncbi:hypothetical protein QF038_000984 [Pseudarthrobacter sp. W1I19]|uniref:hypothetical protein n=1 Tax=Pseudarthrobacter sp. W1I19 TaxID=3042288 RepID=UPI00278BA92C|nr:hypothetical protein [Pseudarthrobacter sp. W1I19]MDQ0922476.1 hypothetical protein [Pseudarthrobacter sp. W1I19]